MTPIMANPQALPDNDRAEFKAWITRHKNWINLAQYDNGKFIHTPAELMAEAWAAARATTAAPVPERWKLVPMEPTEAMLDGGGHPVDFMSVAGEVLAPLQADRDSWHDKFCFEKKLRKDSEESVEDLQSEVAALRRDRDRIDWLADTDNRIGNVQLPIACVTANIGSLRDAIDAARALSSQPQSGECKK